MKIVNYYTLTILLALTLLPSAHKLEAAENKPGLINRLGINIGINFPFGSGVLRTGAYPIGLSSYLIGTHATSSGHNYELLTGVDIMADFGGGIYLALPVLVNRTFELANFGNSRFIIGGFLGLGYSFHHIFSRTEGVTVKNQHTFGLDAGLTFNIALGKKWDFNLRAGIFRSFTKPVQAYFAGTTVTSKNKFTYATLPLLIGFSRKIGSP